VVPGGKTPGYVHFLEGALSANRLLRRKEDTLAISENPQDRRRTEIDVNRAVLDLDGFREVLRRVARYQSAGYAALAVGERPATTAGQIWFAS